MGKVILICGKICSGKTYYANGIRERENAVILSRDEATFDLTGNEQGPGYDRLVKRLDGYLMKKAAEFARVDSNVILDWGFWRRSDRQQISEFFRSAGVEFQWHCIDVDDAEWHRRIKSRNHRIESGRGGSDFHVDEGLYKKVVAAFERPEHDEMDIWISAGTE